MTENTVFRSHFIYFDINTRRKRFKSHKTATVTAIAITVAKFFDRKNRSKPAI